MADAADAAAIREAYWMVQVSNKLSVSAQALFGNSEAQELLINGAMFELLHGFNTMNRAGRQDAITDQNEDLHISVAASASDNVSCLLCLLRGDPSVVFKH